MAPTLVLNRGVLLGAYHTSHRTAYYDGYEVIVANPYARRFGLRLLFKSGEALPADPVLPFRNHHALNPEAGGHVLLGKTLAAEQHDVGPHDHALRTGTPPHGGLELRDLVRIESQRANRKRPKIVPLPRSG